MEVIEREGFVIKVYPHKNKWRAEVILTPDFFFEENTPEEVLKAAFEWVNTE